MRLTTRTRILAVPAAFALGASLFAVSLTWQVPAAQGASGSAAVAQRNEIYRLINGSRASAGKSGLNVDIFLESKASDGAIPCPDDANKSIGGRAADMFATGHMSHNLRLCNSATYQDSATTFIAVLGSAWGYGSRGEILGSNSGFGTGSYTFTYGSFQTSTYSTTGHMMAGWASSPSHWGIVMGQYNRVGCGVWSSGSAFVYACEFAGGSGPAPMGLRGAPRPPAPAKPATPTPTPTPTVIPIWTDYLSPLTLGQSYGSTASTPTPAPTPAAAAEALRVADPTAPLSGLGAAGLQKGSDLITRSDSSAPVAVARMVAFVAGSLAGVFSAILALISMRRRRKTVL